MENEIIVPSSTGGSGRIFTSLLSTLTVTSSRGGSGKGTIAHLGDPHAHSKKVSEKMLKNSLGLRLINLDIFNKQIFK